MNPLKQVASVAGGVLLVVLIIAGFFYRDKLFAWRYNQKTASSIAHGDTAKVETRAADTAHQAGVLLRERYGAFTRSSEVQRNPVAKKVADEGKAVIANVDTEVVHLRRANSQLQLQVSDLESRGPPPRPRAVPYLDPLYSWSSKGRGVPVVRVGVDYRIVKWVHAKVEASYEPPPAGAPDQRPEFRVMAGGHITFR